MTMFVGRRNNMLLLALVFHGLLFTGFGVNYLSYDSTATSECLLKLQKPQYNGGIITNPEFDDGLSGWSNYGNSKIQLRESQANKFIVAHSRNQPYDSVSQKLYLQKDHMYTFSAWIRVNQGNKVTVAATFKTTSGLKHGGSISAESNCWSFLKGGLIVDNSGPAELYFESNDTSVEIWIDSISLQPFTQIQWKSHQQHSIQKIRKSKVRFRVTHANRTVAKNARICITQIKPNFPFGCGMNRNILTNTAYQNWFALRFGVTTFTNEMKWYDTEPSPGLENYTIPDAMLRFAQDKNILVRGHNVLWDNPNRQPNWVKSLSPFELRKAAEKRIDSVVSRYKGKVISWDVVNENLHFRFFEDKLGKEASAEFYYRARDIDPAATMFLNEFNTIEYSGDDKADPLSYKNKLVEILSFQGRGGNISAGIGLQGHFSSDQPNIAYMRSALDILGSTGVPIWLTEVSVGNGPNQAQYLEEILREGYSHPAVKGIIMFAGPKQAGFNDTTLADKNFKNTPAGDVVDKLIGEWKSGPLHTRTDHKGFLDLTLYHGDYQVTVNHPETNSSVTISLRVTRDVPQASVSVNVSN